MNNHFEDPMNINNPERREPNPEEFRPEEAESSEQPIETGKIHAETGPETSSESTENLSEVEERVEILEGLLNLAKDRTFLESVNEIFRDMNGLFISQILILNQVPALSKLPPVKALSWFVKKAGIVFPDVPDAKVNSPDGLLKAIKAQLSADREKLNQTISRGKNTWNGRATASGENTTAKNKPEDEMPLAA